MNVRQFSKLGQAANRAKYYHPTGPVQSQRRWYRQVARAIAAITPCADCGHWRECRDRTPRPRRRGPAPWLRTTPVEATEILAEYHEQALELLAEWWAQGMRAGVAARRLARKRRPKCWETRRSARKSSR